MEYCLPKITIRAKKNGQTLSYILDYLYSYRSVTHYTLHTHTHTHAHTHKDTNRMETYSGTEYILMN